MRAARGMALVLVLMAAVVVFMLGTAFLSLLTADRRQAALQSAGVEARYLARAGMEAYAARGADPGPPQELDLRADWSGLPALLPGVPVEYLPRPGDRTRVVVCERTLEGVRFTGRVIDASGRVLAERTLVVPREEMEAWYAAP